ncbi:MAG: hypothetical protein ACK4IU_18355 [Tabrizicola flagellatus]
MAMDPIAKHLIPGFAAIRDPAGLDGLVGSLPGLQRLMNERLEPMAVIDRKVWVSQIYDVFDEAVRVGLFKAYGSQSFVLSESVVAELLRTDLADIQIGDIRVPFPAFYCAFSRPVMLSGRELEGVYFRHQDETSLSMTLCAVEDRDGAPDWAIEPTFSVTLDPTSGFTLAECLDHEIARVRQDGAKLRSELEDGIDATAVDEVNLAVMPSTSQERLADELNAARGFVGEAIALALNCLCLLTALPEKMVTPSVVWPRPFQPRPGTAHKTERGALPVRFVDFGRGEGSGEGTGGGSSPRAHWRRSHWRRQPYGPVRDRAYRPKWIRGTIVNPGHGPAAEASVYRVNE